MKKHIGLRLFSTSLALVGLITLATTELVAAESTDSMIQMETSSSSSSVASPSSLIESEKTSSFVNAPDTSSAESDDLEEAKAIQAGYSEQQFEQIMSIPQLAAADLPPMPRSTSQQNSVVAKARDQIGKPYAWGASGPNSFDCGGLVKYVYKQAVNVDLPMGTTNQEKYGTEASLNSLQPGDMLFYGNRGATYHVGIY
ncbi:MAG: C40 family peptidase, partial [Enterococcus hulanensis]